MNDIAIIGISCNFPDANNYRIFWDNLTKGHVSIKTYWDDELIKYGVTREVLTKPNFVKVGAVLAQAYHFDAEFFEYTPSQAELIDPQQRLLLEGAWSALEDAGYVPSVYTGKIGVYLSVAQNSYAQPVNMLNMDTDGFWLYVSNDKDFAATRVSYKLNLNGPSFTIQSACSSSLVAVHVGCESLLNEETDLVIVGGVSLQFPQAGYLYCTNLILSKSGYCRPFDQQADGTVFGNGCGIVVLKRLQEAIDDHDNIYAIIKSTAINNDGNQKVDYYSPGIHGQVEVIKEALYLAQVDPSSISYLETHGTGTYLGDPLEIAALMEVFKNQSTDKPYCALGAVKANIGHLNTAAGIAGLIKTALALKYKKIPPNANFTALNKKIDLQNGPFYLNSEMCDWLSINDLPRRAGVSSFGIGGTNFHAILEEYVDHEIIELPTSEIPVLILLSAKNSNALYGNVIDLYNYLNDDSLNKKPALYDIAYSLQCGREHMSNRLAFMATSFEDCLLKLKSVIENNFDRDTIYLIKSEIKDPDEEEIDYIDNLITKKRWVKLAKLWANGMTVDWRKLYDKKQHKRVSLPTYSFDKKYYYRNNFSIPIISYSNMNFVNHILIDKNISTFDSIKFEKKFFLESAYVSDHLIAGYRVLPATFYMEMARSATILASGSNQITYIREITFIKPLIIYGEVCVHIELFKKDDELIEVVISSKDNDNEIIAHAKMYVCVDESELPQKELMDYRKIYQSLIQNHTKFLDFAEIYQVFSKYNVNYGDAFKVLDKIYCGEKEAFSILVNRNDNGDYVLSPFTLDGALQTVLGVLPLDLLETGEIYVPFSISSIRILAPLRNNGFVYVKELLFQNVASDRTKIFSVDILDDEFNLLAKIEKLTLLPLKYNGNVLSKKNESIFYTEENKDNQLEGVGKKAMNVNADYVDLKRNVISYLKDIFSKIAKIPTNDINVSTSFEKYGIDSLLIIKLNNEFEKDFGEMPKTILFEYKTLEELADYFIDEHKEIVKKKFAFIDKDETNIANPSIMTVKKEKSNEEDDVAIIGIDGRFPQADNIEQFWNNLICGKNCITEIPKARWDFANDFDPLKGKPDKYYTKWGGFIEDVDKFDCKLFNISPKEASIMDPQIRLFMETVWGTIEDAGYTKASLLSKGKNNLREIGVFVGVMYGEYQLYEAEERQKNHHVLTDSAYWSIANRVSYFFDFHGPSMAVDSACSSSLTTIHLACEAIKNGDCQMAIAGGVNLSLHPKKYYLLSQGMFASSDGYCRSYGEGGDGYVPGEGVGAILLKPLREAIQDKDFIYAVIKASAINHGGKTNGYTVPNPRAQEEIFTKALQRARLNARVISYLEGHGTGTELGDPIEIRSLSKAFVNWTKDKQFCPIGSLKSNIGHLEGAAGIAGIIKVILQMQYKQIVPSLHSERLNTKINFEKTPFYVQKELEEWKKPTINSKDINGEFKRYAGISSFGAGGANAHVILEEYEYDQEKDHKLISQEKHYYQKVFLLSAKSKSQLKELAKKFLYFIRQTPYKSYSGFLERLIYTLQVGREHMNARLAFVVRTTDDIVDKLKEFINENSGFQSGYNLIENLDSQEINYDLSLSNETKIVDLWIKGVHIDWNKLYNDQKLLKLPLPHYSFEKTRCWYDMQLTKGNKMLNIRAKKLSLRKLDRSISPNADDKNTTTSTHINKERDIKQKVVDGLVINQKKNNSPVNDQRLEDHANKFNSGMILEKLRIKISESLYLDVDNIKEDSNFSSLGLDSILGIELVKDINETFSLQLKATILYEYPNLKSLAEYINTAINKSDTYLDDSSEANKQDLNLDFLNDDQILQLLKSKKITAEQANQLLFK